MGKLPIKLKIFLAFLYASCIILVIYFINNFNFDYKNIHLIDVIFFSIVIAITESFAVPLKDTAVSTSFGVELACFILFGPAFTMLIFIIGLTFRVVKTGNKKISVLNLPIYKTLFSYSIFIIAVIMGSIVYKQLGGMTQIGKFTNVGRNLIPLMMFILIYFLVETLLISMLFSILYNKNIVKVSADYMKLSSINILAMIPFALILVISYDANNYLGIVLVIIPILLARYTIQLKINSQNQYLETINALMHAMEARDKYTEGHSERVSDLAVSIAKELKLSEKHIEDLKIAALLHDVGKIGIDDSVLNKNGRLTDEEFQLIRKHPEIGYNILKDIKGIDKVRFIVLHHHERYDGTGYPSGLSPDQLNLEVFIIGLTDSIDAMLTDRPYRKARSMDYIISEVKNNRGTQFHPDVVDAYFRYLKKTGGMKE
ncbi:MAG: HD-GYP domain-containing protein [Bacillota bacterium]|nr:HD-GYP domain-containing protein [Bacillota bacterium]